MQRCLDLPVRELDVTGRSVAGSWRRWIGRGLILAMAAVCAAWAGPVRLADVPRQDRLSQGGGPGGIPLVGMDLAAEGSRRVSLKSGDFVPQGDAYANLLELRVQDPDEELRVLVSLVRPLNSGEIDAAKEAGLRLDGWCADGVWFARVAAEVGYAVLEEFGVDWLGGFYEEDKVAPRVLQQGWGEWCRQESGRISLQLRYFEDVDAGVLAEALTAVGCEVKAVYPVLGVIEIKLEESLVPEILRWPSVRWIEEAEPPLATFNDSARASVGADSVQGAPYGLSGAGVLLGICDSGVVAAHQDFSGRLELLETFAASDHATHVA